MTGTKLLNAIQAKLIEFANDNAISLHDEFGTVAKFKEFVIAFTFKMLIEVGCTTEKAFDIVFGDGSYNKLAEDVWAKCQ